MRQCDIFRTIISTFSHCSVVLEVGNFFFIGNLRRGVIGGVRITQCCVHHFRGASRATYPRRYYNVTAVTRNLAQICNLFSVGEYYLYEYTPVCNLPQSRGAFSGGFLCDSSSSKRPSPLRSVTRYVALRNHFGEHVESRNHRGKFSL